MLDSSVIRIFCTLRKATINVPGLFWNNDWLCCFSCSDYLKPIAEEEKRVEEVEKKAREEQERIYKQLSEGKTGPHSWFLLFNCLSHKHYFYCCLFKWGIPHFNIISTTCSINMFSPFLSPFCSQFWHHPQMNGLWTC